MAGHRRESRLTNDRISIHLFPIWTARYKGHPMKRWIVFFTIVTATLSTFGCSMCCGPYDYDYSNFGGKHQRVDPSYGRVGSIFSDPNASIDGDSPDSNLEPQPDVYGKPDRNRENLEMIDPMDGSEPGIEQLPDPTDDESTASRLWKRRPLRSGQSWR